MPQTWNGYQPISPSHSNEVENRLTTGEVERDQIEETLESHDQRITFLERMLQCIIYALGILSAGKSGDVVETLLSLLKRT